MAMLVNLRRVDDNGTVAKYWFQSASGPRRVLFFDRASERVWPEDENRDAVFRAAATKLSKIWLQRNELPETTVHQA
ncbi:hypothetical protein [Saccharomonospora saliphila]|uniref:hypothetical protein n=1 Tax=Saccharomonospora saliphila TaxID=369829 RepID=UPI00036916A7|nr:hypothetical protein [Saccharomonospora saliphila]